MHIFGMHLLSLTILEWGGWHSDLWRKGCIGQKSLWIANIDRHWKKDDSLGNTIDKECKKLGSSKAYTKHRKWEMRQF